MGVNHLQTNILCIIVLAIVNVALGFGTNTLSMRKISFGRLLIYSTLICVSDIVSWLLNGKVFLGARLLMQLTNTVYFMAITLSAYAWLDYVQLRVYGLEYNYKRFRLIALSPAVVMMALLIVNIFTGFIFSFDEANEYHRGNGVVIHWIVSWGYLIYATALVFVKMKRSVTRIERRQFLTMVLFIIPPVIVAVLQMFFYGLTGTQYGMTISILIIAVKFLMEEVSKDSLTGLNNRRALENYLSDKIQRGPVTMTVFMCDVDNFKSINDTCGHTRGDIVLKRIADTLKSVLAEAGQSLLLCRYGGDEFLICGTDIEPQRAEQLRVLIEKKIDTMNCDDTDGQRCGISIGVATAVCAAYGETEELIAEADRDMYRTKAARTTA